MEGLRNAYVIGCHRGGFHSAYRRAQLLFRRSRRGSWPALPAGRLPHHGRGGGQNRSAVSRCLVNNDGRGWCFEGRRRQRSGRVRHAMNRPEPPALAKRAMVRGVPVPRKEQGQPSQLELLHIGDQDRSFSAPAVTADGCRRARPAFLRRSTGLSRHAWG